MSSALSAATSITVVLRAAGERTEDESFKILKNQVSDDTAVNIVRKNPFKEALEECFRQGIDSEKKWLVTADADMILLPGAVELLTREAEKMPENYLQLQGKIIDKITGTVRKAGPRVYRISLLDRLLKLSESFDDHIRPESRLITHLGKQGYPSRYISAVLCLHDFEQYYKDIYRKSYVHGRKHPELLSGIIQRAITLKNEDPDYQVMLQAIWDSLNEEMEVGIDTRLFDLKSQKALEKMQLVEKTKPITDLNLKNYYSENSVHHPLHLLKKKLVPYTDQPPGSGNSLIQRLSKNGIHGILHSIGGVLIKTGKKLQIN